MNAGWERQDQKGVSIMRKSMIVYLALVLIIALCSCDRQVSEVSIDYGDSKIYSNQDMDDAISVIKATFAEFDGCTLYSLQYAGDEVCKDNIEYCRSLAEDENIEAGNIRECIVFNSSFQSPKNGGGAWEADTEYTWTWFLAKGEDGDWVLLTYGYC